MARHITIIFLLLLRGLVNAQPIVRYNTFSFNVNEGLLQSTITDIAIDNANFCWISFPNGIQKFDGKNFITVPVQPGLQDDKLAYFFKCRRGDLLISHSKGISKYDSRSNKFIQVYDGSETSKKPVQFIGEDENVIYFYRANGTITGMDASSYRIVSEIKTGFPDYTSNSNYRPKFSDNIINHKIAFIINLNLYLWDLKKGMLLSGSAPITDLSFFFLKLKNENEVLYSNYNVLNSLNVYNFTTRKSSQLPVIGKDDKKIGRCTILPWQNKILLSFDSRLYETDSTLGELKSELVNFQNQPVASGQSIAKVIEDNFGNLYLQTVTGGIKKIIKNNYPFRYYSTGKTEDNFAIAILPDKKNNRILVGTAGNGLLVFDTMQRLIKHIRKMPGQTEPATPNTIIKTVKGTYLLFIAGEHRIWEISNDLSNIKYFPFLSSLPINQSGISYFANVVCQNEKEVVVQTQHKLFRTNLSANSTTEHLITEGYIMSGLFFNSSIITHGNDELIFLDYASFKEQKRIPFTNTGNVRCFAKPAESARGDERNTIYVGSNKGIFVIDSTGKILRHLNKLSGLPDECIYAMAFDKEGVLWCSTNKGILKIGKDHRFQQFKKEDGLQENEFNTNAVAIAENGEMFFGGVNGVSSFYPSAIATNEEKLELLIAGIKINNKPGFPDTASWNINKIDLPHDKNSLSFDFIAMGSHSPGQYVYQYKMEGIDNEWIQNNDLQTVRYFLPPGKYIFQVYASRLFNKDAKPMKEISIFIHKPFWETLPFILSGSLLAVSLLAYIINLNNKRRYERKVRILQNEKQLKEERERISKDLHDSLGAYANAVLYNIELLETEKGESKRKALMGDLKFTSKDIITSLRETVWALKKESYAAEDCLMRIRNFVQPLTRYYETIHFKIEGNTPPLMTLHYTKALNLVRIVQEAVSNSIKHAEAKKITIASEVLGEQWKIVVADDGRGFEDHIMNEDDPGNGFANMKHRAAASDFDFSINTGKNSGTTITIIVSPCQ